MKHRHKTSIQEKNQQEPHNQNDNNEEGIFEPQYSMVTTTATSKNRWWSRRLSEDWLSRPALMALRSVDSNYVLCVELMSKVKCIWHCVVLLKRFCAKHVYLIPFRRQPASQVHLDFFFLQSTENKVITKNFAIFLYLALTRREFAINWLLTRLHI